MGVQIFPREGDFWGTCYCYNEAALLSYSLFALRTFFDLVSATQRRYIQSYSLRCSSDAIPGYRYCSDLLYLLYRQAVAD